MPGRLVATSRVSTSVRAPGRLEPTRFCPKCGGPVKVIRVVSAEDSKGKATDWDLRIVCESHPGLYWMEYVTT